MSEPILLEDATERCCPRVLPAGWSYNHSLGTDNVLDHGVRGLRVILTAMRYGDGRAWLHLSMSRRDGHLPSWRDLREAKDLFIGRDRKAIQVLPSANEYVNINPGVLHLWCCLDGDPLPDFRIGGAL